MAAPFVTWVRFAVHVVLVLVLFKAWQRPERLCRRRACRCRSCAAVFLFGSTIFNFMALQTLQLAETTSIYFFGADGDHRACRPAARRMGRLAALAGDRCRLRRRAGHHPAGRRRLRHRPSSCARARCCRTRFYIIMTRRMSATETPESLILYSALAPAMLHAARRCRSRCSLPHDRCHWLHAVDARRVRRLRPLAADQGLPAGDAPRRLRPIPICRWCG